MLNALENLMVFKAVSYYEQSRSWKIKQRAWLTLFSRKQKCEFKDEANIHILLIYRLPKSSDFLGPEICENGGTRLTALGDLPSVVTPVLQNLCSVLTSSF